VQWDSLGKWANVPSVAFEAPLRLARLARNSYYLNQECRVQFVGVKFALTGPQETRGLSAKESPKDWAASIVTATMSYSSLVRRPVGLSLDGQQTRRSSKKASTLLSAVLRLLKGRRKA
jgi:hypothetical protein